jgi:hypothetical protein
VYQQQQQEQEQEQQDAENPFLDPPFSRIKRLIMLVVYSLQGQGELGRHHRPRRD